MHRKKASETSAERLETDGQTEIDASRRDALISIGKYAAYVTPVMTVLVRGSTALAGHKCSSPNQGNPNHSCVP